jgi:hypothetical protein
MSLRATLTLLWIRKYTRSYLIVRRHVQQIRCLVKRLDCVARLQRNRSSVCQNTSTIGLMPGYHLPALSNPASVSALSKKSISKDCCPILASSDFKFMVSTILPDDPYTRLVLGHQLLFPFNDLGWV